MGSVWTVVQDRYDAIVVGSGISGGWAAKELTERGLKTLVLERGRSVIHGKDYPTEHKNVWELPNRGKLTLEELEKVYPIQSRTGVMDGSSRHFFVKDSEQP